MSPASTLTYLTTQTVYLGSHFGDSQLLQISSSPVDSLHASTFSISPDIPALPTPRTLLPKGNDGGASETEELKGYIIKNRGSYVTVLQTFKNIAPIADAALVDLGDIGQASFYFVEEKFSSNIM